MSEPFVIPNVGAWASKAEYEAEQARTAPRVQRRDYDAIEHADDDEPDDGEREDTDDPSVSTAACRYEHRDDGPAKCDAMDLPREILERGMNLRFSEGQEAQENFIRGEVAKLQAARNKAGAPRRDAADCHCHDHDERKDSDMRDAQTILYGHDPLFRAQRRLDARDERLDAERAATDDAREAALKVNRSAGRTDSVYVAASGRAKGG